MMFPDLERFVTAHRPCGDLTGDVGDLSRTGYALRLACACGAAFEHTIRLRIGYRIEKVRYIGVNAPEFYHPTKGEQARRTRCSRPSSARMSVCSCRRRSSRRRPTGA